MKVSTCIIVTHPPTNGGICEFQQILISYEFKWDSSDNLFEIYHWRRITGQVKKLYQHMNVIEINIICVNHDVQFRDESGLHELNRSAPNISIGLS